MTPRNVCEVCHQALIDGEPHEHAWATGSVPVGAVELLSKVGAFVQATGPYEAAARKAFAEQHPDAELVQVVRNYDAETFTAMGRRRVT